MEPLIIGNWKLNPKSSKEAINTFKAIKKGLQKEKEKGKSPIKKQTVNA